MRKRDGVSLTSATTRVTAPPEDRSLRNARTAAARRGSFVRSRRSFAPFVRAVRSRRSFGRASSDDRTLPRTDAWARARTIATPPQKSADSSKSSKSIVETSAETAIDAPSATSLSTASAYLMTMPTSSPPKALVAMQSHVRGV